MHDAFLSAHQLSLPSHPSSWFFRSRAVPTKSWHSVAYWLITLISRGASAPARSLTRSALGKFSWSVLRCGTKRETRRTGSTQNFSRGGLEVSRSGKGPGSLAVQERPGPITETGIIVPFVPFVRSRPVLLSLSFERAWIGYGLERRGWRRRSVRPDFCYLIIPGH